MKEYITDNKKVAEIEHFNEVDYELLNILRYQFDSLRKYAKELMERGARLIVEYVCENGHYGNIILQFHMGKIFAQNEILQAPKPGEGENIWRT